MYIGGKDRLNNRNEIMLALCLFTSVDTILFGTNANTFMVLIPRAVAIIGIFLFSNLYSINEKLFIGASIFVIIPILSFLLNNVEINTAISKVLFILLGISIASRFSILSFFKVYDRVLYYVSCAAILLEIIAYIAPFLSNYFFRITNEAGLEYISILLSSINAVDMQTKLIRASGIYWEAGAFAGYLLFGLIAQLFVFEETNIKRVIVYLSCMVFTFSTTGAIAVSALLFTYIFSKKGSNINDKRVRRLLVFVAVVFAVFFLFGEQSVLFDKLFGKITSTASTTRTRTASLIVPFYIANSSPLLGVSPNNIADSMFRFAGTGTLGLQASSMCTNTFSYQFAAYGYIFGFFFLVRYWILSKKIAGNNLKLAVGIMLSISLAYAGENFYSFLPFALAFLSYKKVS